MSQTICVIHKEANKELVIYEEDFNPNLHKHLSGKTKDVKEGKPEQVEEAKDTSDTKKKEEIADTNNVRSAVLKLDVYNNDHWNASGEPKMIAIEKIMGHEITRREVDEVASDINRETITGIKDGLANTNTG